MSNKSSNNKRMSELNYINRMNRDNDIMEYVKSSEYVYGDIDFLSRTRHRAISLLVNIISNVSTKNIACLKKLISDGLDLNYRDANGLSYFHIYCMYNKNPSVDVVKVFVKYMSNPHGEDKTGRSPFSVMCEYNTSINLEVYSWFITNDSNSFADVGMSPLRKLCKYNMRVSPEFIYASHLNDTQTGYVCGDKIFHDLASNIKDIGFRVDHLQAITYTEYIKNILATMFFCDMMYQPTKNKTNVRPITRILSQVLTTAKFLSVPLSNNTVEGVDSNNGIIELNGAFRDFVYKLYLAGHKRKMFKRTSFKEFIAIVNENINDINEMARRFIEVGLKNEVQPIKKNVMEMVGYIAEISEEEEGSISLIEDISEDDTSDTEEISESDTEEVSLRSMKYTFDRLDGMSDIIEVYNNQPRPSTTAIRAQLLNGPITGSPTYASIWIEASILRSKFYGRIKGISMTEKSEGVSMKKIYANIVDEKEFYDNNAFPVAMKLAVYDYFINGDARMIYKAMMAYGYVYGWIIPKRHAMAALLRDLANVYGMNGVGFLKLVNYVKMMRHFRREADAYSILIPKEISERTRGWRDRYIKDITKRKVGIKPTESCSGIDMEGMSKYVRIHNGVSSHARINELYDSLSNTSESEVEPRSIRMNENNEWFQSRIKKKEK